MQKTLKLISLNTWGGTVWEPFVDFVKEKSVDTDIFCFQEVFDTEQEHLNKIGFQKMRANLFPELVLLLPNFEASFAYFDDNPSRMSVAIFARRSSVPVATIEDFIVHTPAQIQETGKAIISPRKLQYITFLFGGREFTVAHLHGLWVNGPKTDIPERVTQAKTVKSFLDSRKGPRILCGDFNLLPGTKSLAIIGEGMRNLVIENDITSTRTQLYRHYENPNEPNYADYVFVSPEVDVKKFQVLDDLVSDHTPLFLEFS